MSSVPIDLNATRDILPEDWDVYSPTCKSYAFKSTFIYLPPLWVVYNI